MRQVVVYPGIKVGGLEFKSYLHSTSHLKSKIPHVGPHLFRESLRPHMRRVKIIELFKWLNLQISKSLSFWKNRYFINFICMYHKVRWDPLNVIRHIMWSTLTWAECTSLSIKYFTKQNTTLQFIHGIRVFMIIYQASIK